MVHMLLKDKNEVVSSESYGVQKNLGYISVIFKRYKVAVCFEDKKANYHNNWV